MRHSKIGIRWIMGVAAVLTLLAGACGSDDEPSAADDTSDETTTVVETTEGESADEGESTDEGAAEEEESADEGAADEEGDSADEGDGAEEEGDGAEEGEGAEEEGDGAEEDEEPELTEEDFEDFDAAVFSDPTTVDNRYMPLVPGTMHVYEGTALEDDELIERMVIGYVTDYTKVINGVETVMVWERDFNDGELLESEIVFFAQDDDGNVWHFGQYRETYEDEFVGGRVWLIDLPEGARAGIMMQADPEVGQEYSQGYAPPPFYWTDRATVGELGAETCITDDECFEDVLITEERDDENPGAVQLKFYAPGVGNVEVGWRGPDPEEEEMVLTEDVILEGAERDEANAEALALEERAFMYSMTTPAEPRG